MSKTFTHEELRLRAERARSPSFATIVNEHEDDDGQLIEDAEAVVILGRWIPYSPATYWQPDEGGHFEDTEVFLEVHPQPSLDAYGVDTPAHAGPTRYVELDPSHPLFDSLREEAEAAHAHGRGWGE